MAKYLGNLRWCRIQVQQSTVPHRKYSYPLGSLRWCRIQSTLKLRRVAYWLGSLRQCRIQSTVLPRNLAYQLGNLRWRCIQGGTLLLHRRMAKYLGSLRWWRTRRSQSIRVDNSQRHSRLGSNQAGSPISHILAQK